MGPMGKCFSLFFARRLLDFVWFVLDFSRMPRDQVCTCTAWDMSRQPAEFIFFGGVGASGFRILSSSVAGHEERSSSRSTVY